MTHSDSCQACAVHGDHGRCTGETTLGTKSCSCRDRGHQRETMGLREEYDAVACEKCGEPTLNEFVCDECENEAAIIAKDGTV